jgi:hypothetical protein
MKQNHEYFSRMERSKSDYLAANEAIKHYDESRACREQSALTDNDIKQYFYSMQDTYLIAMYAVFETILRDQWGKIRNKSTHPKMETLVDRIAVIRNIPRDLRDRVHSVRKWRNHLVHGNDSPPNVPISVTFLNAHQYFCQFVRFIPWQTKQYSPPCTRKRA